VRRSVAANAPQQHPHHARKLSGVFLLGEVPAELSAEAPLRAFISGKCLASGPGDLAEFVLTNQDGQYDFAARASLAQHAGTLGCRHRHWWCPMNIEISYGDHEPDCFRNR
jgi:hypothetical protein